MGEDQLESIIEKENVTDVFFSYGDVSHEYVMHRASLVRSKVSEDLLRPRLQAMRRP